MVSSSQETKNPENHAPEPFLRSVSPRPQETSDASDHESCGHSTAPLPSSEHSPIALMGDGSSHRITSSNSHDTGTLSKPTTAVALADVNAQVLPDGSRETYSSFPSRLFPSSATKKKPGFSHTNSIKGSDVGYSPSLRSTVLGLDSEDGSIFGDFPGANQDNQSWCLDEERTERYDVQGVFSLDEDLGLDFEDEFEPVGEISAGGENIDFVRENFRQKKKHFFILSQAGKPIYTRHGDNGLISDYVGIIQTIISFFTESGNTLKSLSSPRFKVVVLLKGPLYLVAISKLLESDSQIRVQLEALYMQILSTLTLPVLERIFTVRPGTDLSRPLQGTEKLLSSLADSFTKGSPSTLLSALECLKIRKTHRQTINNTLIKTKAKSLLYGLLVAGGQLVSVLRPKKHSLHPGDLQLIFNLIFEAEGVKASGGDCWIPICLPGFNSTGYLYMYVSFLGLGPDPSETNIDESITIIFISANKESFYELQEMRNSLIEQLQKNNSISIIQAAVATGRPAPTDIVPGTGIRHFVYKSKPNVQICMPTFDPDFSTLPARRRLLSTYHALHAAVHSDSSKAQTRRGGTANAGVKLEHSVSASGNALAWVTPTFELYCVAAPGTNRNALSQGASRAAQWIQKESERLFIIGGAVF